MEALKKILNIIIDIFIVIVVILSATIAVVSVSSQKTGVPNVFGYVPFSVQTDSMEPTFSAGDLIISKRLDTQGADADYELKVGDVVTFWTKDEAVSDEPILDTHRIVEGIPNREGVIESYKTMGDNTIGPDVNPVSKTQIVAIWSSGDAQGIKISKLGAVLSFLRKPSGFFLAVLLPMAAFFIYELIRFITNFMNYNKEKSREAALEAAKQLMGNDSSDSSGLSEEQKAQAILEYLEKQKADEAAPPSEQESQKAEETEQPAQESEAVTQPEQEDSVSEASED